MGVLSADSKMKKINDIIVVDGVIIAVGGIFYNKFLKK
jgi:hypothetical protein